MHSFISAKREKEKHSACCVRNDKSGCVQTSEEECSVSAVAPFVLSLQAQGHFCSASPTLGFMVTPLLSPAVHAGCVGEVAPSPQHTNAGRKQETVWVCLSSGPQVGPA